MSESRTWKQTLGARIPEAWGREIDIFETQIELRKRGKIEEKLFAETRLRRGAYGQRYDNGQRHDGEKTQTLVFPSEGRSPRARARVGRARHAADQDPARQADRRRSWTCWPSVAEEYSDRILHVTTRQDIQLHFVHIEDTPDMLRRLAAVGITTREACGNTVRNVTACPHAGVCRTEAFDVTPYAHALTFFLLGHHDTQDFGRKFKVAFSGCKDERLRPDELPRPRRHRAHARGERQDRARLRAGRRRRARRGAADGAAVRRVPARGGAAADRAGDEPRVRAPRRASEPRARALQVRGQEAGHRGVQAPGAGGARQAAPRSALDRVPRRPARHRREAAAPRRARCRPGRIPTASTPGARPTSSRSASPATSWRPSRCRSAT